MYNWYPTNIYHFNMWYEEKNTEVTCVWEPTVNFQKVVNVIATKEIKFKIDFISLNL